MIGQTPDDTQGPVELFGKKNTHNLMGKSHGRKGNFMAGHFVNFAGKSISTTNYKHQAFDRCMSSGFDKPGKFPGCEQFSFFIEEHQHIPRGNLIAYKFAFFLFEFLRRQPGGMFHGRKLDIFKRSHFPYSIKIRMHQMPHTIITGFPDAQQNYFHFLDLHKEGWFLQLPDRIL